MGQREPSPPRHHARSWWMWPLEKTSRIIPAITAGCALYTRSAGVAYFIAGAVLCSVTVKILKRFIAQPRPVFTADGRRKKSYGMPSTHSATITFYATYITLSCLYLPAHPSLGSAGPVLRTFFPLIAVPWAATICISRTWLGHHTWPQVGAGVAYGLVFSPIWFALWTQGGNEYGMVLERTWNYWFQQLLDI